MSAGHSAATARLALRLIGISFSIAVVIGTTSCASSGGRSGATARTGDVITADQLRTVNQSNVYDAVQAIRPSWLRACCPNSFLSPTVVQAYVNGVRLRGVEDLKSLPLANVQIIQWFDPIEASSRWGLDHNQGAIAVTVQ